MRQKYEGSGPTLEAALAELPAQKRLSRLENARVEVRIFHGEDLVTSYEGSNYQRVRTIARTNAKENTRGAYSSRNPAYQTKILVSGYY